jgi:hypothetical protein
LNRYLLKNSSSIETEIRSLIIPLESNRLVLVLNIYHYTLEPTSPPLSANSGSLRQSPGLRRFRAGPRQVLTYRSNRYFAQPKDGYKCDFSSDYRNTLSEIGMQEKQTILLLVGAWLFWFALFLSVGI